MAVVGTATLNVVPKFPGLAAAVKSELGKVDARGPGERAGSDYGRGMGGGLAKSGAVIGAFSAVTSRAMDMIGRHVGAAVSRFDTLNNYPAVMQSLGYSAEESEASIAKMSDRLQNLPTTLDTMVNTVKGLSVATNDIGKATDAALALNDMLVASGSNQQLVTAAMEQFRQMLSKGKPEMEDWKSLTSAMPGQLDQLAKSMLGPTANANDLYAALGGGKNDPIISMGDLLDAMIRLDTEGGEGFASFQKQAETAAGGVQTSLANMGNAVTKGIASIMDTVGKENIAGVLDDAKGAINDTFSTVSKVVGKSLPLLSDMYGRVKEIGPQVAIAGAGFAVFKTAGGFLAEAASRAKAATNETTSLGAASKLLGTNLTPASVAITGISAVLGIAAAAYMDIKKRQDDFQTATTGLKEAVGDALALDEYSGKIGGIGERSTEAAMGLGELSESVAGHAKAIEEANEKAEEQIGQLNTAQAIINDYAGMTDLSADAQGRLEWAIGKVNEQFGLTLTAADVANGAYEDIDGNVVNLKDSVNDLIEAKKREIRMMTLSDSLGEAYKARDEASAAFAAARTEYNKQYDYYLDYYTKTRGLRGEDAKDAAAEAAERVSNMSKTEEVYRGAADGVERLETEIGDATKAASKSVDVFDAWGSKVSSVFTDTLSQGGTSLAELKDDLRSLGVHTDDLATLQEGDLLRIADAYDGTASSVVGVLEELNIGMDESAQASAQAASDVRSALADMGLSLDGIDVAAFSQKLADAGVSAEQLNEIGSFNIAQLAESCGGSIDSMVFFIQHYNDTPILDKEGNVQVDDASLLDAQGNLYTWNGSDLYGKDGNAVINDVSLTDAQGNLWTWNGSALVPQGTTATVDDGSVEGALGTRKDWNDGALFDKEASATINIFRNITDFFTGGSGRAAGGIRLNAEGGYRFHAVGAIATKAVPLDIVGEAGAEAIVPLTNRRYSLPFAKTLAEQMGEAARGSADADKIDELISAVRQLHASLGGIIADNAPSIDRRGLRRVVKSL